MEIKKDGGGKKIRVKGGENVSLGEVEVCGGDVKLNVRVLAHKRVYIVASKNDKITLYFISVFSVRFSDRTLKPNHNRKP